MSRNLLDGETSPYLLQHAANPVHWRAWNAEALTEARALNRPIMLSVGYAACHWCHVMAHESFEDDATAALINANFIPIKVDREERPDLDSIYQHALALTGQPGGWPLTMFLKPSGEPFWGGTYFPKSAAYGRPSFKEVLDAIATVWREKPDQVTANADAMMAALKDDRAEGTARTIDDSLLDMAAEAALRAADLVNGGLAGAPKFPHVPLFTLMWRAALRSGHRGLAQSVTTTLDHMCQGGIYDHLGGGFARYSTDESWFAPHFEKMLYDNAQLVELLTLVWQTTRSPLYRTRVEETVGWLLREMKTADGGFAATLDADSDGGEGRYYVWDDAEIDSLLPPSTADLFKSAYNVVKGGNWEDGRSILHRDPSAYPLSEENEAQLAEARAILLARRETRPRPGCDDKILADWNGMMIAALANAGLVFDRPDWIREAKIAFDAVRRLMDDGAHHLGHSFRAGRRQGDAVLDDYAEMARAALVLSETEFDTDLAEIAEAWATVADHHYRDGNGGGYYLSADDRSDVVVRIKTASDAATPSGNGILAEVFARLFLITGKDVYRQRTEQIFDSFSGAFGHDVVGHATLLNAWDFLAHSTQVIVVGEPSDPACRELISTVSEAVLPRRILQLVRPGHSFPPGHPASGKTAINGRATAFVCHGTSCSAPQTDPLGLRETLNEG